MSKEKSMNKNGKFFDFDNPDLTGMNVPGKNDAIVDNFFNTYRGFMYTVAREAGYDYHIASLGINDVLIRLTSSKGCDFDRKKGRFSSYLAQMVKNMCYNQNRRWKREIPHADDEMEIICDQNDSTDSARIVLQDDQSQMLQKATRLLKQEITEPKKMEAFLLTVIHGESVKEVAKKLKKTTAFVSMQKFRLTSRFRDILERLERTAC